jgi:Fur family peroxide stress response transcriptional regulator
VTLDKPEIQRRITAFKDACQQAGVKLTHQRVEIFREVARSEEHPDAETIFARVRRRIPTLSLDTVYRTLATLEKLQVLAKICLTCGPVRFDANSVPHHHFVCTQCGMIRDFSSSELENLQVPPEIHSWGDVRSIHVEVRAVCTKCGKRAGPRKSNNLTRQIGTPQ